MSNGFDDFDIGPQSDEDFNSDDRFGTEDADLVAEDGYGDDFLYEADLSQYDDDPSPYDGTYSEE